MSVTDQARNRLYNRIRDTWGEEDAATMMDLLPPAGWADVVRRSDLDQFEMRLALRFEKIDQRFEKIDQRFEKIDQRFEMIDQRFTGLDERFATKDDLRQQTNRFIGWTFANNAVLIAAVTLIVSLAR